MSARAKQFLDDWIKRFASTGETERLGVAYQALEDAEAAGISEQEMLEAANGNLNTYIVAGLSSAGGDQEKG